MFRIIYYEPGRPYETFDSEKELEVIANEAILTGNSRIVVCVVDYTKKLILNKCRYYDYHRELIDDIIFDPKLV